MEKSIELSLEKSELINKQTNKPVTFGEPSNFQDWAAVILICVMT